MNQFFVEVKAVLEGPFGWLGDPYWMWKIGQGAVILFIVAFLFTLHRYKTAAVGMVVRKTLLVVYSSAILMVALIAMLALVSVHVGWVLLPLGLVLGRCYLLEAYRPKPGKPVGFVWSLYAPFETGILWALMALPLVVAIVVFIHAFDVLDNPWSYMATSAVVFVILFLWALTGDGKGDDDSKPPREENMGEGLIGSSSQHDYSSDSDGDGDGDGGGE